MAQLVKLSPEEREKLANDISQEIDSWRSTVDSIKERWDKCERLYYLDPTSVQLNRVEGLGVYAVSLWRFKAAKLVGDALSGLMSVAPVCQVIEDNSSGANDENLENDLQSFAMKGKYDRALAMALVQSANTNIGAIRVVPRFNDEDMVSGFDFDWIDSKNFVVYPTWMDNLQRAKTVGNRFYQTEEEILAKQEAGDYYDDVVVTGSDDVDEYTRIDGQFSLVEGTQTASKPEDQGVECFVLYRNVEIGGKPQLCQITFAYSPNAVLAVQVWDIGRKPFANHAFLRSEKRIICNDSVGNSVQGYCLAHADLFNTVMQGFYNTCYPLTYSKGPLSQSKVVNYKPGTIIPLPDGAELGTVPIPFDAQYALVLAQKLEDLVDQTLGISAVASSGTVDPNQKATALNLQANADQRRQASYLDAIAEGVEDVWMLLKEYYMTYFDDLKQLYGDALSVEDPMELAKPYRIEVTGRTGESNPQVVMSKLAMAREIAMSPGSPYDANKVGEMSMQSLNLPFSVEKLKKDGLTEASNTLAEAAQGGLDPRQVVVAGLQAIQQQNEMAQLGAMAQNAGMGGVQGGIAPPMDAGIGGEPSVMQGLGIAEPMQGAVTDLGGVNEQGL